MMRRLIYCMLGVIAGSALAWIGLLSWAAINLNPNDSLWDRDPRAADMFFMLWLLLSIAGCIVGLWLGGRSKHKSGE
jgi:hypothetical protein